MKPHPQATTSRLVHPFAPSPGLSFSAHKGVGRATLQSPRPRVLCPQPRPQSRCPWQPQESTRWLPPPPRSSASHSSRTALLLTTAQLYLSTSTRPSSRLHSRLGPLLPASATRPSPPATLATCATLATHMRSVLRARQSSECACLKGELIRAQTRSWKGSLKGVCATGLVRLVGMSGGGASSFTRDSIG